MYVDGRGEVDLPLSLPCSDVAGAVRRGPPQPALRQPFRLTRKDWLLARLTKDPRRVDAGASSRRSVLDNRGFVLLWFGQTVSEFGSMVTLVALPIIAITVLAATPVQVGMVTASAYAAWLVVGLPAGAWIDRVHRRPVMVVADLLRAAVLATVPVAWVLGALTIWQLAGVAFTVGLLSVVFETAWSVYVRELVDRDQLVDANGKLSASASAAMIGGPGLGGALLQIFSAPLALIADALSFLVSAICLYRIRVPETVATRSERRSLRDEIAEGLRYVFGNPFPRAIASANSIGNFVLGGYEAVLLVFLASELDLSAGLAGALFGLGAIGGLVGSLLAAPLTRRFGDAVTVWIAPLVTVVGGLLTTLAYRGPRIAWYVAGSLLLHGSLAVFNICVRSALQIGTPPELLGRAGGTIRLFSRGTLPLGALFAGILASATSARTTTAVLMTLLLLTPAALLLSPVRTVRDIADLTPAAEPS